MCIVSLLQQVGPQPHSLKIWQRQFTSYAIFDICGVCMVRTYYIMFSSKQACIVLKSGWSSTARMPAWSLVLLPCLRLIPRRHGQADGQLSPRYPPSPSFSSFGAAYVSFAVFLFSRWSETSVSAVSSSLKCPKYSGCFAMNMKEKSSNIFSDAVDALKAMSAVWTRPSSKSRSSATNHGYLHARQATISLAHIVGEAWTGPKRCRNSREDAVRVSAWREPFDGAKPCVREAVTIDSVRKCSPCFKIMSTPK